MGFAVQEQNPFGNLGQVLGQGIGQGFTTRSDELSLKKAIERLPPGASYQDVLKTLTGTPTYSQEAKQQAITNLTKGFEFENKAAELKQKKELSEKENQAKIQAATITAKGKEVAQQAKAELKAGEKAQTREQQIASSRSLLKGTGKYSDEEIEVMANSMTPQDIRTHVGQLNPVFEKESDKLAAKRVNNYIEEVEGAAKNAQTDLTALDIMENLSDQGATGFKAQNALADYLESKGFKNLEGLREPGSKAFNSVAKVFMRSFGETVKGKVSDNEFKTLKGMLAQAEDRPESAKAIMMTQRLLRNIDIKQREIMEDIQNELIAEGKSPYQFNLNSMVEKRLRPIADAMTAQTNQNLRALLYPSKIPEGRRARLDDIYNDVMGKK